MHRYALAVLLLVGTPLAAAQSPSAPSAADVLDRINQTYATLKAIQARFEQRIGEATLEGTIYLQGDRFRVELPGQTIVSDGETAWSYSEEDQTVLISHVAEDPAFFSPGELFLRYPERFDVRVVERMTEDGTLMDVLALTPKDPADPVEAATLYVRVSDAVPMRVEVTSMGQRVTILLGEIRLNPTLDAGRFSFSIPDGADVIDLRS